MKYNILMSSILALGLTSCGSIQDGKYLGGMVEVSSFSKSEKKESGNTQEKINSQNGAAKKAIKGCSKNDSRYHPRDRRWCANLFLPGADFSKEIIDQENVSVPVDLAYIRAKRHLNFKDPDDTLNSQYNERYEWDGIAGTYYGVKGRFGGPLMQMLYYCNYDLQIEKINDSSSKIKVKYQIYGRDVDSKEFSKILFNKIRNEG